MKKNMLVLIIGLSSLTACGGDKEKSVADMSHLFDKPYQCYHESTYIAKSSGKEKISKKMYFYHPQKHWFIYAGLSGMGVANLYTPTHRYDGVAKSKDGKIRSVKFMSAWLSKKPEDTNRSKRMLNKVDKKNCSLLTDASIFDIDYLDKLEIMNGDKKPDLDKVGKGIIADQFKDAKIPQRFKDAIDGKVSSKKPPKIIDLKNADEATKKNKEMVLAAIASDEKAIVHADDSLKKDKEVMLAAVNKWWVALKHADDSLKKDREVVLAAINSKGNALKYADKTLRKDKDLVMAAVSDYGRSLKYADKSLKKDKEVVLAALKNDKVALKYVDESLKNDADILKAAEQ